MTSSSDRAKKYLVLKFYEYKPIANSKEFSKQHYAYCLSNGIRGRIKIAQEGINGTVCGLVADCERYMDNLKQDKRFAAIQFNITPADGHVHERLQVLLKKEILHSGLPTEIMPATDRKKRYYIDAATFQRMRKREDVTLIDVRSKCEYEIGKFENAITFGIHNFREFPKKAKKYAFDKNKKYIVICTRGIKSEKARDYLRKELKLPHVFHLEGGILDYAQNTNGEGFQGVCYVFDNRVVVPINQVKPTLISHCYHCQTPSARMINCANPTCNTHVPICAPCCEKSKGACSKTCQEHPSKRHYNGTGYYVKRDLDYDAWVVLQKRSKKYASCHS